jgi:superkiller protein 3
MTRTRHKKDAQVPISPRKRRGITALLVGLAIVTGFCLLARDGVGMLYHNVGSISLSKGLAASEAQEQEVLLGKARALFSEVLRWNHENRRAYYNLGRIYLAKGQESSALEAFQQVVELEPREPYAHQQLGMLYDELGEEDAALRAWGEAASAPALVRQGLLCRGQEREDCAERFYKLALSVEPGYADAHYYLGMLYTAQGRDTAAIEALTRALQSPSLQTKKRYLAEARLHSYAARWDDAILAYQLAIKADPRNADAYVQIASILLRQFQDEQGAIEWYLAAMEAEPYNAMPYLRLANLYWAREDCSQAERWYRQAAAVAGKESESLARAQMGLTRCARLQGDLPGALRAARGAVDAQPDQAIYHVLLGDVYAQMQRSEDAIASYRHALALDPTNKRARRQLEALGWEEP